MNRVDENTLVVTLVEGPEIFEGLRITRKFKDDGLEMVRNLIYLKYLTVIKCMRYLKTFHEIYKIRNSIFISS